MRRFGVLVSNHEYCLMRHRELRFYFIFQRNSSIDRLSAATSRLSTPHHSTSAFSHFQFEVLDENMTSSATASRHAIG